MSATPVLHIANVRKNYQGLRPLRLRELVIMPGEQVAVSGLDAGAAEVLVNLVTGASLPDEGEVRVLGHSTADVTNGDEWLASLDRFGIVSPRAVLLDAVSALQNLALPFTLQIDPIPRTSRIGRSPSPRMPVFPAIACTIPSPGCRTTCGCGFMSRAPSRSIRRCSCSSIQRRHSRERRRGHSGGWYSRSRPRAAYRH